MEIDTARIPQESLADLMRSLGAALDSFRRSPDSEQRLKDYKDKRQERTKTQ